MLNILYGHDSALLKSFSVGTGQSIDDGDWVSFNASTGKLEKITGTYDGTVAAFPVYGGNKVRFDAQALGVVTVCMGKSFAAETDKVASATIVPGDALSIISGVVTKANSTFVIGYALSSNTAGSVSFTRA